MNQRFRDLPLEMQVTELAGKCDDLVDALERAIEGLLNPCSHPMAQQARIKRARAAIAKAKGN